MALQHPGPTRTRSRPRARATPPQGTRPSRSSCRSTPRLCYCRRSQAAGSDSPPPPVLPRLAQQRLLRPDELYLLSPYDDSYALAADAEELFSLRKFEIFTNLCSILGATRVVAQRVDIETCTEHQQVDLTDARGPVTAKANASRDIRESMARRFSLTTSFEAGEPRVDQAAELLESHG